MFNPENSGFPHNVEVLSREEEDKGTVTIEKERMIIEGSESNVVTVTVSENASLTMQYDKDLIEKGIITEPGGSLIDQKATADLLGRPAGFLPEDAIADRSNGIVLPLNHYGWQEGAFLIRNGEVQLIKNDEEKISGRFEIIASKQGKWYAEHLDFLDGALTEESTNILEDIDIGFSAPLIVKDAQPVDTRELLHDPRLQADYRNVIDFGGGNSLPAEYFALIRKVMPSRTVAAQRLVRGDAIVNRTAVTDEEFNQLKRIKEEYNLDFLRFENDEKHGQRFAVVTKGRNEDQGSSHQLPLQKMPLMGYGVDKNGRLLVVAVDGRQKNSAGVTIDQLAHILKMKDAEFAGLTCGGGDVAVVSKENNEVETVNVPSNIDVQTGKPTTRPIPSVLVIKL